MGKPKAIVLSFIQAKLSQRKLPVSDGSRFEALALLKDLEEHGCHGLQPDLFSYVSRDGTAKNAICLALKFTDLKIAIFACKELPCRFDLQQTGGQREDCLGKNMGISAPNGCDSIYVKYVLRSGSPGSKEIYFAMDSIKMIHIELYI